MALTYDWSVDLGNANSTITLQYHAVPPGSLVLDVGCATGFMGQALSKHKSCTYVGVELDSDQAAAARERGIDVRTGDVTDAGDRHALLEHAGRRFDVVILGDVLEHLNDPFSVLETIVEDLLDRGGLIITSIPNVTHGSLRLDLLRGRFTYTTTGLLDVTHVQLFTRDRVGELFQRAGLQVVTDQRSYFPVFGTEGRVQQGELPDAVERFVLSDPESFTYQFITTGRPALTQARLEAGRGRDDESASTDPLRVVVVGAVSDEWRAALDLALPDRYGSPELHRLESPDELAVEMASADGTVLALDGDVVPAASWMSPLLDAHRRHGGAVGAIRTSSSGLVDAAGWTSDGLAVGRGMPVTSELLCADRAGATLGMPWVGDPDVTVNGAGRVTGRLVAASLAPTSTPASADGGASVVDAMGAVTLVAGRRAPQRLPADQREALVECARLGTTLYRWTNDGLDDVREHSRHLLSEGLTLIGGHSSERPDVVAATWSTAGLARALDASRVVWLDAAMADEEAVDVGLLAPMAERSAPFGAAKVDRHDIRTVLREAAEPVRHPVVVPEQIEHRATTPGRVSVVVPMYGLGALTLEALRCVQRTTSHLDVELVVVDNGSPAEDATLVREGVPGAVIVTHEENLGFARGVNAGIRASSGELVCILNNDTEPLEGWLDELVGALERPNVLMAGSRSDQISRLQQILDMPRLAENPAAARLAGLAHAESRSGRVYPLARLVGFCLLVRRDTLEVHGGFCVPDALGNFEDDELSRRLLDAGGDLLVADGSVVLHHGSATFRRSGGDYADQLLAAARSLDSPRAVGGLKAVVMSDGDAAATQMSVSSALTVCDDVVVLTTSRLDELRCSLAPLVAVSVHQSSVPSITDERPHLVLAAGERLAVVDAVEARTNLYAATIPASLTTSAGAQQRWLPGGRFDLIGPGEDPVSGLAIT